MAILRDSILGTSFCGLSIDMLYLCQFVIAKVTVLSLKINTQKIEEINLLNLMFIGPYILIYFYSKTNEMYQFLKFILFCSSTLHVLDDLSVHHQEPKTVHIPFAVCTVLKS
jgi:hypothetical protein